MTSIAVRKPPVFRQRVHRIALIACAAALVANVLRTMLPALPRADDYTIGYAPWWITVIAAALGIGSVLAAQRQVPRQLVIGAGWTAAVVLLWSSAGMVLDGFRAFFAITGIPAGDFAIVDWPGFAARVISLGAAASVVVITVRTQRQGRPGCAACGRTLDDGVHTWLPAGYVALPLMWPYPMLKVYWWLGGSVLRPEAEIHVGLPVGEVVAALLGSILALALTQPWGQRFPRWVVLAGGWLAAGVLLSTGALSVFGTLSQFIGLTDGPVPTDVESLVMVSVVYGSWFLLGVAFMMATWRFQQATRPPCATCEHRSG